MKYERFEQVIVGTELDEVASDPQIQACLRLWAAKLVLHLRDYEDSLVWSASKKHDAARIPARFHTAQVWVNDTADHVGSFAWICELFNINPDYARRAIKKKLGNHES